MADDDLFDDDFEFDDVDDELEYDYDEDGDPDEGERSERDSAGRDSATDDLDDEPRGVGRGRSGEHPTSGRKNSAKKKPAPRGKPADGRAKSSRESSAHRGTNKNVEKKGGGKPGEGELKPRPPAPKRPGRDGVGDKGTERGSDRVADKSADRGASSKGPSPSPTAGGYSADPFPTHPFALDPEQGRTSDWSSDVPSTRIPFASRAFADDPIAGNVADGQRGAQRAGGSESPTEPYSDAAPADPPSGPPADHLVHIYEFGQLKRTLPHKFTDEEAVSFSEEYTRTSKIYGRLAVAMPDDEIPAPSFADAARG